VSAEGLRVALLLLFDKFRPTLREVLLRSIPSVEFTTSAVQLIATNLLGIVLVCGRLLVGVLTIAIGLLWEMGHRRHVCTPIRLVVLILRSRRIFCKLLEVDWGYTRLASQDGVRTYTATEAVKA